MDATLDGVQQTVHLVVAGWIARVKAQRHIILDIHAVQVDAGVVSRWFFVGLALLRTRWMRFYAAFLVERPHALALAVLAGQRVRDIKDRDGKKMTDGYVATRLQTTKTTTVTILKRRWVGGLSARAIR